MSSTTAPKSEPLYSQLAVDGHDLVLFERLAFRAGSFMVGTLLVF